MHYCGGVAHLFHALPGIMNMNILARSPGDEFTSIEGSVGRRVSYFVTLQIPAQSVDALVAV